MRSINYIGDKVKQTKALGKIESIFFGVIDGRFGIWFTFKADGWSVQDNNTTWDPGSVDVTEGTRWTEDERASQLSDIMYKISRLLKDAAVSDINELKNTPVEITLEGNMIKDWRVLTEVI